MPAAISSPSSGLIEPVQLAEGRRYYKLDGELIGPSVTTIIDGALGHAGVPKEIWERAGARGRAVHAAIYYYEGGIEGQTLDVESLHPEVRPHFEGYLKFKREHPDVRFSMTERRVVSLKNRYGGTLDACYWDDGDETLADWKSGIMLGRHGAQTAAYKEALVEAGYPNAKKLRRRCVYLTKDADYQVIEHSGEGDFYDFLACHRLFHAKEHHSGKY